MTVIKYYYKPANEVRTTVCLTSSDFNRFYQTVEISRGAYKILEVKRITKESTKNV